MDDGKNDKKTKGTKNCVIKKEYLRLMAVRITYSRIKSY